MFMLIFELTRDDDRDLTTI